MSLGEQCFICHLEHNKIKEISGFHKKTSCLTEIIPLTPDVPHSNDRSGVISAWCISMWQMNGAIGHLSKSKMSRGHWRLTAHQNTKRSQSRRHSSTCLFSSKHRMLPMINISLTKPWTCNILQTELCAAVVDRHSHVKDSKHTCLALWKWYQRICAVYD